MASVMISPGKDARDAALRSFTTSLALFDTLVELGIPAQDLALKWPNDVLFQSGKLAGILLESSSTGQGIQLCIGIGVNLVNLPEDSALEASSLTPVSLNGRVCAQEMLSRLALAFARWENVIQKQGFSAVRYEWLSKAARVGEMITAKLPSVEYRGMFETIDDTGALVLKTPNETLHLPAADVFF